MANDGKTTGRHPLEAIHPRSLKHLSGKLRTLIRSRLWLQVLIAMLLGIVVGIVLGPSVGWVPSDTGTLIANWLALPGKLFLVMIQMVVIPLVFASIIRGLAATEDIEQLRRTGTQVVIWFVATTALAIVIGITLAGIIQPGRFIDPAALRSVAAGAPAEAAAGLPSLTELPQTLISVLPTNPLNSMVEAQMLQVVIFALFIGIALIMMPAAQSRPLLELTGSLQAVCMTVVRWAMQLAPLAVFGLLAQLTMTTGLQALSGVAVYVATVILGLLVMLVFYCTVMYAVAKRNPLHFLGSVRELLLLAFSTSSSAAVMPLSIRTAEDKLGVRPSISQFVIPMGATINMNGTALYQGVAAIFLAQVFNVDIGMAEMLLLILTAVGASIGAPGTPGIGIVIMAMLLGTIGVPPAGIALIMGVDRILDMCRTAINVSGDLVAAVLMDRWVGGPTTAQAAMAAEAERDRIRKATGSDVLVNSGSDGAEPG